MDNFLLYQFNQNQLLFLFQMQYLKLDEVTQNDKKSLSFVTLMNWYFPISDCMF